MLGELFFIITVFHLSYHLGSRKFDILRSRGQSRICNMCMHQTKFLFHPKRHSGNSCKSCWACVHFERFLSQIIFCCEISIRQKIAAAASAVTEIPRIQLHLHSSHTCEHVCMFVRNTMFMHWHRRMRKCLPTLTSAFRKCHKSPQPPSPRLAGCCFCIYLAFPRECVATTSLLLTSFYLKKQYLAAETATYSRGCNCAIINKIN